MNPILQVISFLFKKKNIDIDIKACTIKSFFDSGILFPKFVSLAFKIDLIPTIHLKPKQDEEKYENNKKALQFLLMNNESIAKTNPSFKNDIDQYNLLKQILTKQCFSINEQEIIYKCNRIFDVLGVQFSNINDLINWKSLLSLLNILSDESYQQEDSNTDYFYKFVEDCFIQSKVPFVLDEKSLEEENRFLFLIQIEILIDFYSEKFHQIISHSNSKQKLHSNLKFSIDNSSNKAAFKTGSSSDDDLTDTDTDTDIESSISLNEDERRKNLLPRNYKEIEVDSINDENDDGSSRCSELLDKIKIEQIEVNYNDESESSTESSDDENEVINEVSTKDEKVKPKELNPKKEKEKKLKKREINEFILYQNKREEALLNTLNSLSVSLNMNKHFANIHETIEDDWIPKFVMFVFHIESIKNVYVSDKKIFHGLKNLSVLELKNINAVIEFLREKEPKFEVLKFKFSNSYLSDSSAILFYTTFLNFFFLKRSKKELFDRCVTILFPEDNKNKDELNLLTNWFTYINLIHFVVHGEKMANYSKKLEEEVFKKGEIPKIIDENYLSLAKKNSEVPDEIYYQLQFIFDALDTKFVSSQIAEIFRIAISKLKVDIKIDLIAASIRAKNISLILQIRRHSNFIINNQKAEEEKAKAEKAKMKTKSKKKKNKKQKKEDKESKNDEQSKNEEIKREEEEDDCDENVQMNYLDRLVSQSDKLLYQNKNQKISLIKLETADEYWNSTDSNYIFENGILINRPLPNSQSNQLELEWSNEISKIFQKSQTNQATKNVKKSQLFNDPSLRIKSENEFYKLFVYNEHKKEWLLNHDDLNKLGRFINSNSSQLQTPLVLFMNSSETDLVSMNSNLINGLYPNIEENKTEIFIYALCDRFLSHLSYNIEPKNKKKSKIKPIFLLLHVPKEKENHPRIQGIVASIYSYLSSICDLKIVLLDEKNYKSQIKFIEIINKISMIYEMKNKNKEEETKETKTKKSISFTKKDTNDVFIDEIYDSDSYDEDDLRFDSSSSDEDLETNKSDILNISESSEIKRKIVFLINETSHELNENSDIELNESHFFKEILKSIQNEIKKIHFINTNNSITYKEFLNELNEFSQESQKTFDEIKEKFEIIEIINIAPFYISMKMNENWKNELEKMINKRHFMLMKNEPLVINCMKIISKLQKEISEVSLSFDFAFQEQCKFIIENLKIQINKNNREICKSEIKTSSKLKKKTLSKYQTHEFKSIEKVQNIINEHIQFIKEEFFNIIQSLSDKKFLNVLYEDNIDILNNQINEDIRDINNFIEKKKTECDKNYSNNEYLIDPGTNYSIREAQNEKELKILIDVGKDLNTEIKQDF